MVSRQFHHLSMNIRLLTISLTVTALSLGCNVSDANPPRDFRPVEGQPCANASETFGNLTCDGSTWRYDGPVVGADMDMDTLTDMPSVNEGDMPGPRDMANPQDMQPGQDMPSTEDEDMSSMCTPAPADDVICQSAGATCGDVPITNACDTSRTTASCGDCQPEETCVANSCVCQPIICDMLTCGLTTNTCGSSEVCGCLAGSVCQDGACADSLTILPPNAVKTHGSFGHSVAIRGNVLAIGAPDFDNNSAQDRSRGAVFLYRQNQETLAWELTETILSPDDCNNCRFGAALDFDESQPMLVIGEPGANKVHVYIPDPQTGALVHDSTITRSGQLDTDNDRFGFSVAIDMPYLLVGAPYSFGSQIFGRERGSAHLYEWDNGGWDDVNLPDDIHPNQNDTHVGWDVDIVGDRIAIGAPGNQGPNRAGKAYVLELDPTDQDWNLMMDGEVRGENAAENDLVGASVALGAMETFISAPDAQNGNGLDHGRVFTCSYANGDTTEFPSGFHMPTSSDNWGYTIATLDDLLVIGISGIDVALDESPDQGDRSGVAIYRRAMDGSWAGARLFLPDPSMTVHAGVSVALSDRFIVLGATSRDPGSESDRVYLLAHPQ